MPIRDLPRSRQMAQSLREAARTGFWCTWRSWSFPLRKGTPHDYFSDELMSVNLEFTVPPRPLTMAMMASAMPAAIRPYSIAVAPDSSDRKLENVRFNSASAWSGLRDLNPDLRPGRDGALP